MYNRQKAYEYAKKWAYGRNPQYYNYDPEGNMFISKGHWTDFVITIPGIGVIPYFIYK